jgi:hypothetical protein
MKEMICLPIDAKKELHQLTASGGKSEAVKQVIKLTGASPEESRNYVDALAERMQLIQPENTWVKRSPLPDALPSPRLGYEGTCVRVWADFVPL